MKVHLTLFRAIVSIVLTIIVSNTAFALPDTLWTKTYGGIRDEYGQSFQQTPDNGYIIVGSTESFGVGSKDVWLLKTDESGDTLWTKTYGGNSIDRGYSVQQTTDGGYIVTGNTWSYASSDCDVWLIKINALGDTLWTKTYGGYGYDHGRSVIQTSEGGYIVLGTNYIYGVWLMKIDSFGDTTWTKTFSDQGSEGNYINHTDDGGYIITGSTSYNDTYGNDLLLIKTDSLGNKIWEKNFGGSFSDYGQTVQQTIDKGFIIAGFTFSFSSGDNCDAWLIKTDSFGVKEWEKIFGGDYNETGYSVKQTSDEGYILCTNKQYSYMGHSDAWIIKIDALGDTTWTKTLGGTGSDIGRSIIQTTDGGYTILGNTSSYGEGGHDVWLIKTDPNFPPIAEFTSNKEIGVVPLTCQFNDMSDSGTGAITDWLWDFGDGNNGTEQNPLHTYKEGGNYTVNLIVIDEYGKMDSTTKINYITAVDLVINEIMQNPSVVDDNNGEWIELLNLGISTINLKGWEIKDNGTDSHIISDYFSIESGYFAVLGNNSNYETNGNVRIDYQYSDISLGNSEDEIVIKAPFGTVDSVAWDNGINFPDPNGASMALTSSDLDNSVGTNWTMSITPYGNGDLGTPGLPNFSAKILVQTDALYFPNTMVGLVSTINLNIMNDPLTSLDTLLIDSIYCNTDFFIPSFSDTSIMVGDTVTLKVKFIPESASEYNGNLYIECNDYNNQIVTIYISGVGIEPDPDISVSSDSLDFGIVDLGDSSSLFLTVYNVGLEDLEIDEITISNDKLFWTTVEDASIIPGDSLQIPIYCVLEDLGDFIEYIRISSNDPETPQIDVILAVSTVAVSIDEMKKHIPKEFALNQNYPNPFNPKTIIPYQLPKSSFVKLSIYDISGRFIETIVDENKNAGYYSVNWNAYNMASGIYIYRIDAGEFSSVRKCLVIK